MTPPSPGRVLVIDPGRDKYGWAVFVDGAPAQKGVQQTDDAPLHLREIARGVDRALVGKGTHREPFLRHLQDLDVPAEVVDETGTTQAGIALYFLHEAPRGPLWWFRRLLNMPRRPIDDWAAVAIGQRFFASKQGPTL